MYDVFISHSSLDKESLVRPITRLLESYGLTVWLDENVINPGDSISNAIFKGLSNARLLLLVVSPRTWKSNWSFIESGFFLSEHENCKFVPLLFGVKHKSFAARFPFLADKKYFEVKADASNIGNIATQICELCEEQRTISDIPEPPFTIKEIIVRLNSFSIQKTSELLTFLRAYERARSVTGERFIWAEKILQRIALDRTGTTDLKRFLELDNQVTIIIRNHVSFFLRLQDAFVLTANIPGHQLQLLNVSVLTILDWYTTLLEDKPSLHKSANLTVVPHGTLTEMDIKETYHIEKLVLRPDLISSWDEAYEWYLHNPLTFLGVRDMDTGKIVAFCTLLPVSEEWYSQFRIGKITDTTIALLDIRQYDLPDFYNIYISSVCVHPEYQGMSGAFTLLYNAVIDMFLHLAQEQEIYIYRLLAEASTLDGERLCRFIDMREVGSSEHGTRLYESYLIPPTLRLKSRMGKNLIDYYNNKYSELKELLSG